MALVDASRAVPILELAATARAKHGNDRLAGLHGDSPMSAVITLTGRDRDMPVSAVISPPADILRQSRINLGSLDFW
jgi:hypothetical protein